MTGVDSYKQKKAYIFIDEFGTPALNVDSSGVEPYFIYVAVLIESENLEKARATLQSVRDKYNQGSPLKANKIPNNDKGHSKRLNILRAFSGEFPHIVKALIVDKKALHSPGLGIKKVFIKYFNQVLLTTYNSYQYSEIHVVLDRTGYPAFIEELSHYMAKHIPQEDLFHRNTFTLKDDKEEEPLLQIADFYASCIGKVFCDKINTKQSNALYNCLREYTFCEWFPREKRNYLSAKSAGDDEYSENIVDIAVKSAHRYLESPTSTEIGKEIVKYFLVENGFYPFRIICSGQIKARLKLLNLHVANPIEEIAHLRDSGVLIISPLDKKGYKLPCNIEEIKRFYDRISTNVIPQLKRAYVLDKVISEGSVGKINILKEMEQLSNLVRIVTNSIEEHIRQRELKETLLS